MTDEQIRTNYASASSRSADVRRRVEASAGEIDPSRRTTRLVGVPMEDQRGVQQLQEHPGSQHLHMPAVNITNGGSFYRPWKEELYLSGWKTFGNFLAWPWRLMGRLFETVLNMFAGVLKMMLIFIVAPSMLFAGYSFYQSHKGMPAPQMAEEIGQDGVHIVGGAAAGIWHGIFDGGPKHAAPAAAPAADATDGDGSGQDAPRHEVRHGRQASHEV